MVFLGFVVWIFMAVDGSARIERGCRPVGWAGNVAVSLTALVLPKEQSAVKKGAEKAEYSCRYATWRLFYQADYNRAIAARIETATPKAGSEADVSASTVKESSPP